MSDWPQGLGDDNSSCNHSLPWLPCNLETNLWSFLPLLIENRRGEKYIRACRWLSEWVYIRYQPRKEGHPPHFSEPVDTSSISHHSFLISAVLSRRFSCPELLTCWVTQILIPAGPASWVDLSSLVRSSLLLTFSIEYSSRFYMSSGVNLMVLTVLRNVSCISSSYPHSIYLIWLLWG